MAEDQKPKDPNWVCTFTLKKNPGKTEKKHPDFILVDSESISKKTGKPHRKNFTIEAAWCEAAGYLQSDQQGKLNGQLKITIKKTGSSNGVPKQASASQQSSTGSVDDFMGI